jgi:sirohydrochlorin ferrochelatase
MNPATQDDNFEEKMKVAEDIIARYANTLKKLARATPEDLDRPK